MYTRYLPQSPKSAVFAVALLLLSTAPGVDAQQCPASHSTPQALPALTLAPNNQYFRYNNQTIPLIGLSSEYLCHVAQPGTWVDDFGATHTPDLENCTWANYPSFIDRLALSNLNHMRVWIGLNHSPGRERNLAAPYAHEQPFTYNSGTQKWDLNTYDQTYWDRLKCVIGYAGSKGVIVEVTLFDPWSGDWTTGPWHTSRNSQAIGFSSEEYFAKYFNDPSKNDTGSTNGPARAEQMDLVRKAVAELNAYPNIHWELANEPDLPPGTGPTAGRWQDRVAQTVIVEEAQPGRILHLIGVEQHTDAGVAVMLNSSYNPSLNTANVVSAHYVTVEPAKGDYGAIELIRTKHGLTGLTQRAWGFNEGRATPSPANAPSARAEAWEFAVNEGGLYDNYNLHLFSSPGVVQTETNKVFNQLGKLKNFLTGLNGGLDNVSRDACGAGCWLTGQGAYKAADAPCAAVSPAWTGSKYWATMHSQSVYVAYFHHSKDTASSSNFFSRYEAPPSGCPTVAYRETALQFKPDVGGTYIAEWVAPGTNTVIQTNNLGALTGGVTYPLPVSPTYTYDIALRIRKQP